MKRTLPVSAALFILLGLFASAQESRQDPFEASLYLGYGKSPAGGRSTYRHEWSSLRYAHIAENDLLSLDSGAALCAAGFLSFYPVPHFGVQAGFGYFKASLTGSSNFVFSPPPGSVSARSDRWAGEGELTAVPLCLNAVGRAGSAKYQAYASGGIALFLNSFFAESSAGLGAAAGEKIDSFKVPVAIEDQAWTALGLNFGGGFDFKLAKRLALSVEIRYFLCPARDFAWIWAAGVYDGLGKAISALNVSQETAQLAAQRTTSMTIRPSFFQISAGVKFFLPGVIKISTSTKSD